MPFVSSRPKLKLSEEEITGLEKLSQSRSQAAGRHQGAEMYLREVNEEPVVSRWKHKLETLSVV